MVRLLLMFVIIGCVFGRPPLPPLPMKGENLFISSDKFKKNVQISSILVCPADGCYLVNPEVGIFRVGGEAVILSFPMFERVLEVRRIAPPSASFVVAKGNGSDGVSYQGDGRVQQRNKQLWFLPAEASDSGEYVCSYR